jgi:hypothetical protein
MTIQSYKKSILTAARCLGYIWIRKLKKKKEGEREREREREREEYMMIYKKQEFIQK